MMYYHTELQGLLAWEKMGNTCQRHGDPLVVEHAHTCSSLMYSTALMRNEALSVFSALGSSSRRAAKLHKEARFSSLA